MVSPHALSLLEPRAYLVPAQDEHCALLAESMDPDDVEECRAGGFEPRHAVEASYVLSWNKLTLVVDGHVAAMFGTVTRVRYHHLAAAGKRCPEAQLWFLTSVHMAKAPCASMKLAKHVVTELLKHYDSLWNYIDARHHRALRLAQWLGGELGEPEPYGPKGALFRKYTIRRATDG